MLAEGFLGLMAVLAATAGFASSADWWAHYSSWGAANAQPKSPPMLNRTSPRRPNGGAEPG